MEVKNGIPAPRAAFAGQEIGPDTRPLTMYKAPAGAEAMNEGGIINGEQSGDNGSGDGLDGNGAGGQTGGFAAASIPGAEGQSEATAGRAQTGDLRAVIPAELGIKNASTAKNVMLVDANVVGGTVQEAAKAAQEYGFEPVPFRGQMTINGQSVNGYIADGKIFFRTDAADSRGNPIDPKMIVDHELFHNAAERDPQILDYAREYIRGKLSAEAYSNLEDAYAATYSKIADLDSMADQEVKTYLLGEIAADAYAGLNDFGGVYS